MRRTEKMAGRAGSAIVFAMLLLVLLSAIGMYAVSLPYFAGEGVSTHYAVAVSRNMARAGAHAAIARLPELFAEGAPYVRRIPVGPDATGRYSVTSRRASGGGVRPAEGEENGFEDFLLVSEGSLSGSSGATFRVRTVARLRSRPDAGPRARILSWEETGPQ